MKQEDKELLFKDLCARLPYGVIVRGVFINYSTDKDKILYEECDRQLNYQDLSRYESLKPYLRPMSSMTEEEKEQIRDFWIDADVKTHATQLIDFYNKYHFDYRGLIEKGLAIEVTEENNHYED